MTKLRYGKCTRCGEVRVRTSNNGFGNYHTEKKGNVKCLSCQRCDGVTL